MALSWKDNLPGEDNDERPIFTRRGWSLEPKTPDDCKCVAVRIARTPDGATHRLYKYLLTAEVFATLEQNLANASIEIRRTDLESEIAATRADIARLQQHLAEVEATYEKEFSAKGKQRCSPTKN